MKVYYCPVIKTYVLMNEGRIKTLDTFMEKPELILDPKGNILNVTNRPKKIWGYYTEELIGKSLI